MAKELFKRKHDKPDPTRFFDVYGAAKKLWTCRDEAVCIWGPAGTGKTRTVVEKAHFKAMTYPGYRALFLRKTRESLTESVLNTYEEKVLPEKSPILNGPHRRIRQDYIYPGTRAKIVVGGLDNPAKVMSTEYDDIFVFEATEISENDFEMLTTRLGRNEAVKEYSQIVLDCNPVAPTHWINQAMKHNLITSLRSVHKDNPYWYDHIKKEWHPRGLNYMNRLKKLTGVRYRRLFLGEWVAAEGVVFAITPEHIKSDWTVDNIPHSWRRIRSIDFGFTKPFVCQWWAIDPDGRMYLYREIYFTGRLVRDHAKLINVLSAGEKIEATVADWDAEGRADLESNGIPTIPAFKDIKDGIEATSDRLRDAGDGKFRLYFLPNTVVERDEEYGEKYKEPLSTVEEADSYVYKPNRTTGKPDKEEPIDEYNHGMDAMRYAVCYVDNIGMGHVEVQTAPVQTVFLSNEGLAAAAILQRPFMGNVPEVGRRRPQNTVFIEVKPF
jgi:PBSX family phage terminase large subunit